MAFVYILQSRVDHKYYIGSTTDLARRLKQHNSGIVRSTKPRIPFKVYAYAIVESIQEAAILEKKFKNSTGMIQRYIANGKLTYSGYSLTEE